MPKHPINVRPVFVLIALMQGCGIFSFQLENPSKPGRPLRFSEEEILLGELNKYRTCFDTHYYDLTVNIDPKNKSLEGKVSMYATALADFDTLQMDLHRNFEITALTDTKGSPLPYSRNHRAVMIDHPHKKGEQVIVNISYEGSPPVAKKPPWKGGFVWKKDGEKKDWIGVACESEGSSVWWPLKDHTSDEPDSMRMHYTVPEGLIAVGNGQLISHETEAGRSTFHWYVSYPINTYNVSVYAADFQLFKEEYTGIDGRKMDLAFYVLKENHEKATAHFKQTAPMIRAFEYTFGPYPWYNDGFKLIESPYAGMEHQTAIAYGNGYKDHDGKTDYIILHETAHEWWGNSITAADLGDVWLQEGFATYAEALYYEKAYGETAYHEHLRPYRWMIKNQYPLVGPKDRRWFHFKKSIDVYFKGAWLLHTLREQLENDELFFRILKTFYNKYEYSIVSSEDFVNHVNESTGKDYHWFFNQYLYNNFVPELEVYVALYPDGGSIKYRWAKTNEDFNQFKVKLRYNGEEKMITPTGKVQTLQLAPLKDEASGLTMNLRSLFVLKENKGL